MLACRTSFFYKEERCTTHIITLCSLLHACIPLQRPRAAALLLRRLLRAAATAAAVLGNVASAFAEGWVWSTSWAMANRAMDAVLGPRTFRIEHAAATTTSAASAADDASSSPSNPCQIHAMAFQDVCLLL